jgi:tetratricopeptide (TPR) repeat protein
MVRTWRRAILGVVLLGAVVAGGALFQRLSADRQYQRLISEGDRALATGDSYRAVEAFSGALAFRPQSMVAYLRRGEAYRAQRRHDEAIRDWREATRLSPDAPQPLVALGDLAEATGDFSQAAEWYGQAAERLKDGDPSLLYRLALARYQAGSPGGAIDPLERAVARNDASAETHYLLGLLYRDTNNAARALQSLEAALAIAPDLVAAREELADLYRAEGRPVDEMAQLQALARDGQTTRKVAIGLAEARQGQLDAAIGTLSGVLAAAPNDSRVLVAIGRVYLSRAERGHDPEAIRRATAALEQALGGTARRSEGLALYGRALFLSGNYVDAERILRDAVATSPVDPEGFLFLADAAEQLGHALIARDALVNLDALQGDTATASVRLNRARRIGELSLLAGDFSVAAQYLDRVVDAEPGDWLSQGLLAEARWRLGERNAARRLIEKAIAANPRDRRLQRIARMVR